MRRVARGVVALAALVTGSAPGCGDEELRFPVAPAEASRHGALREALASEARAFGFRDGDWTEDQGDAPFYGLAWLTRAEGRTPEDAARREQALARARRLLGEELRLDDLEERLSAALGMTEHLGAVAAAGDAIDGRDAALLDAFLDRLDVLLGALGGDLEAAAEESWAVRTYGATAMTALVALLSAERALLVPGPRAAERRDRAVALERGLTERAFGELADAATGRSVRAYAFAEGRAGLSLYPNVAMLMLDARLFRLTRDETYRVGARALHAALQPLKLSDAPARYASPDAAAELGATTREALTLSSQSHLARALLLLFEITGEARFVDEADRVFDGIEAMRGPWCTSQVHDPSACAPACGAAEACALDRCEPERCTTGLLHHLADGRLARPGDETLFCSGCNLQVLYTLGVRRALSGQAF